FVHRALDRALAAGMAELDRRNRAHLTDEAGYARIGRYLVVALDRGAAVGFASPRLDRGFLVEHDARAADGVTPAVHQMPVDGRAVHRAILAHRRDDDAVAGRDSAQFVGLEQQRQIVLTSVCHASIP